jgi:hypothetical protein
MLVLLLNFVNYCFTWHIKVPKNQNKGLNDKYQRYFDVVSLICLPLH